MTRKYRLRGALTPRSQGAVGSTTGTSVTTSATGVVLTLPAAGADASPLLSSGGNGPTQPFFVEPGSSQVNRVANVLTKPSTEDFWRMWTYVSAGGPGKKCGIRFRQIKTTATRDFNVNIEEGVKPWFKWAAPGAAAGPDGVVGGVDATTPGSYAFMAQTNSTNKDMIAKRSSGAESTSVYTFFYADTMLRPSPFSYPIGTVEDAELTVEFTDTSVILQGYRNGALVVTATDVSSTRADRAGYLGLRADGSSWQVLGDIEVWET